MKDFAICVVLSLILIVLGGLLAISPEIINGTLTGTISGTQNGTAGIYDYECPGMTGKTAHVYEPLMRIDDLVDICSVFDR